MLASKTGSANDSRPPRSLVVPKRRDDIGQLLEQLGLETGAELGVQQGVYSEQLLKFWPSCKRFYLVDAWRNQSNYIDAANVGNEEQNSTFSSAMLRLSPWANKTIVLRMLTSEAAPLVPDDSLDFVYVDARHDYCGVSEDIELYWPKVRDGGILAGHDYLTAGEAGVHPNGDWRLCANGTRHPGAVKGAVDDFARRKGLQISVTYAEERTSYSWMVRRLL